MSWIATVRRAQKRLERLGMTEVGAEQEALRQHPSSQWRDPLGQREILVTIRVDTSEWDAAVERMRETMASIPPRTGRLRWRKAGQPAERHPVM